MMLDNWANCSVSYLVLNSHSRTDSNPSFHPKIILIALLLTKGKNFPLKVHSSVVLSIFTQYASVNTTHLRIFPSAQQESPYPLAFSPNLRRKLIYLAVSVDLPVPNVQCKQNQITFHDWLLSLSITYHSSSTSCYVSVCHSYLL
jgi:hypothetical protein